jgi:hypothetical protein
MQSIAVGLQSGADMSDAFMSFCFATDVNAAIFGFYTTKEMSASNDYLTETSGWQN